MIQIEQIPYQLTWKIRHEVMYPEKTLNEVKLENDDEGYHFGLYDEGELTSVVSLFKTGSNMQLRKFATLQKWQKLGYGSRLLEHCINFCRQNGVTKIWCNARTTAIAFYKKHNFIETETTYFKDGHDFVIMELSLTA